ncbi:MAG: CaiB/BaiF CoA transferase family protein, partial [Dehalococcoidia bacterium]
GTTFAYLNTGKSSVVIDLSDAPGQVQLETLLRTADAVIESASPGPLTPMTRRMDVPSLVRAYVSPFGLSGPYANYRSTSLTDFAAGGQMYLTGEPDREPLQGAGPQAQYAAGLHAFIGIVAALRDVAATGEGQEIDVSHMETMASLHQWTSVRWTHGGKVQRRIGNRYDTLHPVTLYACLDGFVAVSASTEDQAERLMAVAGVGELHEDPRFRGGAARLVNAEAFDELLAPWLMAHTAAELVDIGQTARIPVAPAPGLLELVGDPHLAARGFWQHPVGETDGPQYPGPPFRISGVPWKLRPAPRLGEGAVDELPLEAATGRPADPTNAERSLEAGPLAGIRVLDLSRVWAGPLACRILGDLGADVIKVEPTWGRPRQVSPQAVQVTGRYPNNEAGERSWNREGMFNKFNRNKRAITLNLDRREARAVFEDLVAVSDVVIENYSPRVMPQLGLGYERLREINPAIVYVGMPGYGWDGPYRDWVAYGTTLEPHAGLSSMMGYRDSGPYKSGVAWADPVGGMHAAAAVLLALHDRAARPDGNGHAIELAQFEGMMCLAGEEFLAAQVRGREPERRGNRHADWAPQGVYRCAGDDRWLAISVTGDDDWRAFCGVAGLGDLARLSVDERRARHDQIDERIEDWTRGHDHMGAMELLQDAGVPAIALFDARELVENEHLRARGFWKPITHPDSGTYDFPGLAIALSRTPATIRRPAPGFGQHNREVLAEVLGMGDDGIDALFAAGILVDVPDG